MSKSTENPSFCVHVNIDGKSFTMCDNWKNDNNELQIRLDMSDATSLCITHVTHNLKPHNTYYTVKHHANPDDVIAQTYRATNHEKCSFVYPTLDQLEAGLTRYLNKIRTEDNVAIIPDQKGVQSS